MKIKRDKKKKEKSGQNHLHPRYPRSELKYMHESMHTKKKETILQLKVEERKRERESPPPHHHITASSSSFHSSIPTLFSTSLTSTFPNQAMRLKPSVLDSDCKRFIFAIPWSS